MNKKTLRLILFLILVLFLSINIVAVFQAYKFTHYDDSVIRKEKIQNSSWTHKLKAVVLGVDLPRPEDTAFPERAYETIRMDDDKNTECWFVPTDSVEKSKGTVILCHGYGGSKSSMLLKADVFLDLGYNVFLFDFMGSGGSGGNQTTIGYYESEQVKTVYDYILAKEGNAKRVVLLGTSMGAVAIMKAVHDYEFSPGGIILECPYSTMLRTVQNRFHNVGFPKFPMANLLVFWGGAINGFNAFGLEPVEYVKSVSSPVLLIYGQKDDKVMQDETDDIYRNIERVDKYLVQYPLAGHDNYLEQYAGRWTADIREFLDRL